MIYTVSKKIVIILFVLYTGFLFLNVNASAQSDSDGIDQQNKANALKNKVDYMTNIRKCGRLSGGEAVYGTPTKKYFDAAKVINLKLQDLWDKGQTMKEKHLKDAYSKLAVKSLSYANKCLYSRTIDAIEIQRGDWRYHKVKNGVTTIGIDFWSYKENLSEIDFGPISGPLFQLKNSSTKVREYTLSSKTSLQSLYVDKNGFATSGEKKIYLTKLSTRLTQFCNNEKIYTSDQGTSMNRNENNMYCVKNRLKANESWMDIIYFGFNSKGEISKINLDRRRLILAN